MKYVLTPTERGESLGKKTLEFTNEKQAWFAMSINPGCYTLTTETK